ncbi:MAG: N-acetylglucosamine-6-phosphate deacetylase [Planctomycetia bacterium]|nr:N-acetylglucosamine-6-phosphate deacetylase [Planctomycetia bacterium]
MSDIMEGRLLDGRCVRVRTSVCQNGENAYDSEFLEPLNTKFPDSLPLIAPGIVDLQVNGFAAADFNDPALTLDGYIHALQVLRKMNVTTVLPTLITNDAKALAQQLALLESFRQTCQNKKIKDLASAPMYHLEGPFISSEDGYRGAHPLEFVREPTAESLMEVLPMWMEASNYRLGIMTFSPHMDSAADFLSVLRKNDILPAFGHTHASAENIHNAALKYQEIENRTPILATHLGNACPPLLPRHENPIWALLSEDSIWISMIADGFHLPPDMLKVFWRMKGEKTILVSDATQFTSMPPGKYKTFIGGDVTLTPEGKLFLTQAPKMLAGAARSAYDAWKHLLSLDLAPPEILWKMVSENPSAFLRYRKKIEGNYSPFIQIFLT